MKPNNVPVWILGLLLAISLAGNVWLGMREVITTNTNDHCTFITVANEQAIPVILENLNKEGKE